MPPNHRWVKGWSPDYFLGRGSLIGPQTTEVVRQIFARAKHPEQAYKSCLGLLALAKQYTPARLEAAAARALHFRAARYRTVKDILDQGLDALPLVTPAEPDIPAFTHDNVRGPAYYR
jgi:hypothetical protein